MIVKRESIHGYEFDDSTLLKLALTHRSVSSKNNERLEFLGDSLLGLILSIEIMKKFPRSSEGELTRIRASLVNGESLANLANQLGIGEMVLLGDGERKSGGYRRPSILADVFEAVVGAIYLDSDFETVKDLVLRIFKERIESIERNTTIAKDAKTILQEHLQSHSLPLPVYDILEEIGPDHQKDFLVECKTVLLEQNESATAGSKRKAEQAAATLTLKKLGLI